MTPEYALIARLSIAVQFTVVTTLLVYFLLLRNTVRLEEVRLWSAAWFCRRRRPRRGALQLVARRRRHASPPDPLSLSRRQDRVCGAHGLRCAESRPARRRTASPTRAPGHPHRGVEHRRRRGGETTGGGAVRAERHGRGALRRRRLDRAAKPEIPGLALARLGVPPRKAASSCSTAVVHGPDALQPADAGLVHALFIVSSMPGSSWSSL